MIIMEDPMNSTTVSIAEGKKGFSRLIHDTVEKRENTIVTRRGKPVAVIIPYEEYERNTRMEGYKNIANAREVFLKAGVIADDVYRDSRAQLEEKS
jgi:prevent-host-death family protein